MQNTKIDGKPVNIEKIKKDAPIRENITRIKANSFGELEQINGSDIILPDKKLFADPTTEVLVNSLDKGVIENKKVDEYNDSLFETVDPIVEKMELLGPKVLVRLYRLKMYDANGVWTGGRTTEVISESEMRKKKVQLSENMQYQDRAVVIKVSKGCNEDLKNSIKPGDIIDLDPVAFNPGRMQRWLDKDNVNNPFKNYFIIPDFIIEGILRK